MKTAAWLLFTRRLPPSSPAIHPCLPVSVLKVTQRKERNSVELCREETKAAEPGGAGPGGAGPGGAEPGGAEPGGAQQPEPV